MTSLRPTTIFLCLLVAGWASTGLHAMEDEFGSYGFYGYGSPPPAYGTYYADPGYGYYPAPTYGYASPEEPVSPSPEPSPPTTTPVVSPTRTLTECPACPTCASTTASTSTVSRSTSAGAAKSAVGTTVVPAGHCYCPYDSDWDTWALDGSSCRAALKTKCQSDGARLPCAWVDSYYSDTAARNTTTPPHAADLVAYLYNDCPPAAPCSCSVLSFTPQDSATLKYACCQDLRIYAAIPYSGLSKVAVDAYCGRNGSPAAIQKWVQHTLWHQNCTGKASTGVYIYSADALASSQQQQSSQASASTRSTASGSNSKNLAIAASAAGIGGAAVGALMAAAVLAWWARRNSGLPTEYNRLAGNTV